MTVQEAPPEERDPAVAPDGKKKVDWGRYGRGPILLLAGVGLVDAIDKGILPGVLTLVQEDLGFSDFQLGMLEFAFVIATFLVIVPAGYLADRGNRTRIIATVLASWAVISAITATVRNFIQFFAVRAALGVGETIDDPASQSLISDYYPARIRGRAYSYQRVTPTLGRALGTIFGGIVGAIFGWRAAFLLVGIPGSILAVYVWRMKEPKRGEADLRELRGNLDDEVDLDDVRDRSITGDLTAAAEAMEPEAEVDPDRIGVKQILQDIPRIVRIPSLRALIVGFAVASGALSGIGFWAVAYNERHSDLSGGAAAALTGLMILSGAILGTLIGGRIADRVRDSSPGAPMAAAGIGYAAGGLFLLLGFLDVPVYTVRLPLHTIGVAFVVGGFPATYSMISEVVGSDVRGQAFAATRFFSALIGAFSPPLIGLTADQFPFDLDGRMVGNLGIAFSLFMPFLFVGAYYLYRGRVHVEADRAAAEEATLARYGMLTPAATEGEADDDGDDDDRDWPDDEGGPSAPSSPTSPPVVPSSATPPSTDGPSLFRRLRHRFGELPAPRVLAWSGVASMVVGVLLVGFGWYGAAGAMYVFDQVPFAISGGLLGVALLGLGATLAVVGRLLGAAERREQEVARARAAVDGLRATLLGEG